MIASGSRPLKVKFFLPGSWATLSASSSFPFRKCGCPVLAFFARAGHDADCSMACHATTPNPYRSYPLDEARQELALVNDDWTKISFRAPAA